MNKLSDNIYISDNIGTVVNFRAKKNQESITNKNAFARYLPNTNSDSAEADSNLCVEFDMNFPKIPINSIYKDINTKYLGIPNVLNLDVCNDKEEEMPTLQFVKITNTKSAYNTLFPNLDILEKPKEETITEFINKNNSLFSKQDTQNKATKYFPIEKKDLTERYIISLVPSSTFPLKPKQVSFPPLNSSEATNLFLTKNKIAIADYNKEIKDYLDNTGPINKTNFKYIVFYNLLKYILNRQIIDSQDINEINDITNKIVSAYFKNNDDDDDVILAI